MWQNRDRIAVGVDDSPAAQQALAWAAREAGRRGVTLLVVTAWTRDAPSNDADPSEVRDGWVRMHRRQRRWIADAVADLDHPPPVVAREVVLADPVTALCHAARLAELLVVGGERAGGWQPSCTAAQVARRLAHGRRAVPVMVISEPASTPANEPGATGPASDRTDASPQPSATVRDQPPDGAGHPVPPTPVSAGVG